MGDSLLAVAKSIYYGRHFLCELSSYHSVRANTLVIGPLFTTLENIACGGVCKRAGVAWVVVTFSAWQLKFKYNNIAITSSTHFFTSF